MKTLLIVLTMVLAMACAVGCSGEGEGNQTENATKETSSKKSPVVTETSADAGTAKTFPVRNETNPIVTIVTDSGMMIAELYRDVAPAHADSFVARASEGFYDSLLFFRIIDHFMVQTGDPMNKGMGNAGYYINAEFSDLPHEEGTLSMARAQSPNSASCQFFVVLGRNKGLDGQYTVFGHLLSGFDVLHKVGSVPVGPNPGNPREKSSPLQEIRMLKVYLSDAEGNQL